MIIHALPRGLAVGLFAIVLGIFLYRESLEKNPVDSYGIDKTVCPPPETLVFESLAQISRSVSGFTQGLVFEDGFLLESTGRAEGYGDSVLNRIHPTTGEVTRLLETPEGAFGEGVVRLGDVVYQLTYRERKIFRYVMEGSLGKLRLDRILESPFREGWGLSTNGEDLLATDGSAWIYRLDPNSLQRRSRLEARDAEGKPIPGLNEIEYVSGQIYANLFPTPIVVRLDAETGCETGRADLTGLASGYSCPGPSPECIAQEEGYIVPNGIAYDAGSGFFYVTGKSWKLIHRGRFRPAQPGS